MDVPFGWPQPFVRLVNSWAEADEFPSWASCSRLELPAAKELLKFRLTDRFVRLYLRHRHLEDCREGGCAWPSGFSVSTDKMGVTTIRAVRLLAEAHITDRIGLQRRLYEVYPAASLAEWHLYQRKGIEADAIASELVRCLEKALESAGLRLDDAEDLVQQTAQSGDHRDALVAAITAWAAWSGCCLGPHDHEVDAFLDQPLKAARRGVEHREREHQSWHTDDIESVIASEGWIHVPIGRLEELRLQVP